jgi:FkbM family methyltransferase
MDKLIKVFHTARDEGIGVLIKKIIWRIKSARFKKPPDEIGLCFQTLEADKQSGFMIDVGAQHGGFLSPFAKIGWKVIAFEPDSKNRKILFGKFNNVPNVQIDPRAVSNEQKTQVTLFRSDISDGISSLSAFHPSHKPADQIEVVTLASVLSQTGFRNLQTWDLLKVDTEGYDLFVLEGVPWETVSPRMIICEFEDSKTKPLGYEFDDLIKFLTDKGYQMIVSEWYPIKEYGDVHRWRRFIQSPYELHTLKAWGNIIAVKEPRLFTRLVNLSGFSLEK